MLYSKVKYPFGKPAPGNDVLWRCEARNYSVILDAEAELYCSRQDVELRWYLISRRTPCGAWIGQGARLKFVRLTARKKFACNTEREAIESFIARKKRHISILEGQITVVRQAMEIAKANLEKADATHQTAA